MKNFYKHIMCGGGLSLSPFYYALLLRSSSCFSLPSSFSIYLSLSLYPRKKTEKREKRKKEKIKKLK